MVVLPDDTERIQSYLDANPKSQLNRIIMYMPVYPADNGTGIKTNNNQPTPQPEATPITEEDEFMSCPNTPSEQQEMAPKCTIPPNAPQVEKIVLETSSSSVKSDKLAISEKPRTRSVSSAGKFTIPESITSHRHQFGTALQDRHRHCYCIFPPQNSRGKITR